MPAVAAAAAVALKGVTVASVLGSIATSLATSLVLSGLQRLIAGKPPKPSGSSAIQNSGITQQIRQAIVTRKPVYGEVRRSGGILYLTTTADNKYLHLIVEVAPHEVQEIGEIWLNDTSIPPDALDANGNVTSGRYSGKVRLRTYLGTPSQTADALLVAESAEWTTNHRLQNIAYIYARLEWNEDIFPSGVPNISAWVKGKKVYDPRTTLTMYHVNPALVVSDYLEEARFGLNADSTEIDQTYLTAAANTCDEFVAVTEYNVTVDAVTASNDTVTLDADLLYFQTGDRVRWITTGTAPAGLAVDTDYYVIPYQRKETVRIKLATSYANALAGTAIDITDAGTGTHTVRKTAEPRYTCNGVLDTENDPSENIKDLLSAMGGQVTYTSGTFKIQAAAYETPTVYFNEGNIMSGISVQTKVSRRERFNTVRGTYISPINEGQPSDYPEITNSTYVTADLEEIVKQIDLPYTSRPHTAQRIAKINLELSRQEITFSAEFDLTALQVIPGDNVYLSFARLGWTNKVFNVKTWDIEYKEKDGTSIPVIKMSLREIAAANYDWNNGEETLIDPAPNTTLPDIFNVPAVTGFGISSEAVQTQQGDNTFKVLAQWSLSSDSFVLNGGFYEIQYKRSADTDYRPTFTVPGSFNFAEVTLAANLNEDYDIRIRAVNSLGVRSGYTSILGYLVGTSGGVGTTEDWGLFSESVGTTEDWALFSDTVSTTEDWGFFT